MLVRVRVRVGCDRAYKWTCRQSTTVATKRFPSWVWSRACGLDAKQSHELAGSDTDLKIRDLSGFALEKADKLLHRHVVAVVSVDAVKCPLGLLLGQWDVKLQDDTTSTAQGAAKKCALHSSIHTGTTCWVNNSQ